MYLFLFQQHKREINRLTLTLRRRIQNNTGGNITSMRFRVVEITTFPATAGVAELRVIDSTDTTASDVLDTATCSNELGSPTPPCIVSVKGTTLEQPPVQAFGGGINSSLRVALSSSLANGKSINVQFRFAVHAVGSYNVCLMTEGSPSGGAQVFCESGHTEAVPPTISKAFNPTTIPLNGTSTLTFTVTNPNATTPLNGVAFTDTLPSGLVVADTPNVSGVCSGSVTATAASNTISLSGGTIGNGGNCIISVDVKGTTAGTKNNTTGAVSSTNTGTGQTSNTAPLEVLIAATSTAVTSSVNPSTFGQSVTFTATVTSAAGTPTGSVQFKDGVNNLGSPVPLNGSGVAQLTTSSLTVGTHTITAEYQGDGNFDSSTGTLAGGQVVISLATWTTTGDSGVTEDESNPARPTYTNFTASPLSGTPAGTYLLRYNITAMGNLTSVGSANTRLRVRFRDEGAGSRVIVAIVRSPITGGATTLGTVFDSDNFAASSGFQTQEVLMPALVFDFSQNTYWLQVTLVKDNTTNQPGFGSAQISQQ